MSNIHNKKRFKPNVTKASVIETKPNNQTAPTSHLKKLPIRRLNKYYYKKYRKRLIMIRALHEDPNSSVFASTIKTIKLSAFQHNIRAFGKWLLVDFLWCLVGYLPYAGHQQILNQVMLLKHPNGQFLWFVQQRLLMSAIISGVFILVALLQIIKRGWFHYPLHSIDVAKKIDQFIQAPSPTKLPPKDYTAYVKETDHALTPDGHLPMSFYLTGQNMWDPNFQLPTNDPSSKAGED